MSEPVSDIGEFEQGIRFDYVEVPYEGSSPLPQVVVMMHMPPVAEFHPFDKELTVPVYVSHTGEAGVFYSIEDTVVEYDNYQDFSQDFIDVVSMIPQNFMEYEKVENKADELDSTEYHIYSALMTWFNDNTVTWEMSMLVRYCGANSDFLQDEEE